MSFAHAARSYARVAVESSVNTADPHQLVVMLYDGAIAALNQAHGHLAAGRVAEKAEQISRAARIIDEGLKAGVDVEAGGAIGQQLVSLYEYMSMRLLQANLRNDAGALEEVVRLLSGLRSAWVGIKQTPAGRPAAAGAARVAVAA